MMQSIQALKNAVVVLSKHHSELQLDSVKQLIQHHLSAKVLTGTISPTQHKTLTAFLQQPAGFQSYAPASGQIFGILKQMKETFESNLSQSQKDELAAQDAFSQLKSAKIAEIDAAKRQVEPVPVPEGRARGAGRLQPAEVREDRRDRRREAPGRTCPSPRRTSSRRRTPSAS